MKGSAVFTLSATQLKHQQHQTAYEHDSFDGFELNIFREKTIFKKKIMIFFSEYTAMMCQSLGSEH